MKNFPEHYKELNTWMEKLGMDIPEVCRASERCTRPA